AGPPSALGPELPDDFQTPAGAGGGGDPRGTPARAFPAPIELGAAMPPAADPIAVDVLPDGTVLVLARREAGAPSEIYRYRDGAPVGDAMPLFVSTAGAGEQPLVAHDMAFIAGDGRGVGTLYVASHDGNQCLAFRVDEGGAVAREPRPAYYPMRLFGGKAIAAGAGGPYYDLEDRFLPLVAQALPRFAAVATVETRVFDGKDPGCVWHRL